MMSSSRQPWRKSTYSSNSNGCVETASQPGTVAVRDSKDPDGPRLAIPAKSWAAFTARVQTGR